VKTDKEKIPLILRRTERGLEPKSKLAAELLAEYALHSDVEITIKKRRSLPQLALYWLMLRRVVDATGSWPSAQHLHEALKLDMGYVTLIRTMDGTNLMVPDSVALARMDATQFKAFFDAAAKRLAEVCGFDPLELETEKEAA
jgi:hypothetical protein